MANRWQDKTIIINGREYPAYVNFDGKLHRGYIIINGRKQPIYNDDGILRFVPNEAVKSLVNLTMKTMVLNKLPELIFNGEMSIQDYAEFQMMHGGSIGYFTDSMSSIIIGNDWFFTGAYEEYLDDRDIDVWREDFIKVEDWEPTEIES